MTPVPIPPASRAGHGAAGKERYSVVLIVAAARRRDRLVRFVQVVGVAAPGGLAIGASAALAGWAPAWLAVAFAAAGVALAGVWVVVRAPSSADTAAMLDARLGLRDRVAAALQLRGDDGAIAALVSRDAATRLASVRLNDVFPLRVSHWSAVTIPAALLLTAWLVWIGPIAPGSTSATAGRSAGAGTSKQSAATASPPLGNSSARGDTERSETAERSDSNGGQRAEPAPSAANPADRTTAAADAANRPVSPDQARPSTASSGAYQDLTGAGRQAGTGSATNPGRSGAAGASAPDAVARRAADGAGGVSRGASDPGAAAGVAEAPAALAARYAAARTSAEAALARDVIPPDYRDDVRAYFNAIAPGGAR